MGKGKGNLRLGTTQLEQERMQMLLEERTYADAAKRLGITENAMKQSMSRVFTRYTIAKSFTHQIEGWKAKRKMFKRGK